jgi:3-dehydrosphinganine reductase
MAARSDPDLRSASGRRGEPVCSPAVLIENVKNSMNISGKCAIVAGGSVGIGRAIADELARLGANIFLIARREEPLAAATEELKRTAVSSSQTFSYYRADVSDWKAVGEAIKKAEFECGPPAVLVNSAGFSLGGYVEKLPISDIETEIKVNYLGTVYTVKQVISGMIERRQGWILNISSLAGLKGIFGFTGYSAAKFAVIGFSEALRSELRPYGIHVSVLCPPDVDTDRFINDTREKPLENLMISKGAKLMHADEVARAAIRGMKKGSFIIIPGFSGKLLQIANRFAPWLVDMSIDRTVDKARKERGL